MLAVCATKGKRDDGDELPPPPIILTTPALLLTSSLQLSLLQNLLHNINILVRTKVVLELLLRWVTHDTLCTLTRVEDLERVDDVGEGDRLVSVLPLLEEGSVGDDYLVEVRRVDVGFVDYLVD